jgi:hypothetical protein
MRGGRSGGRAKPERGSGSRVPRPGMSLRPGERATPRPIGRAGASGAEGVTAISPLGQREIEAGRFPWGEQQQRSLHMAHGAPSWARAKAQGSCSEAIRMAAASRNVMASRNASTRPPRLSRNTIGGEGLGLASGFDYPMAVLKNALTLVPGGVLLVGLSLIGGWGPCGPSSMGAFFALIGGLASVFGGACTVLAWLVLKAARRFRR